MRKTINGITKLLTVTVFAAAIVFAMPKCVKADAAADALAVQQAQAVQTALYQQQLAAVQQAQAAQAALYQQQLAAVQQAQAALLAQYQQAAADQYAKALLVYQESVAAQQRALQQAYMLNSVQQLQQAQYESMIKQTGLDYQQHLLSEYSKYQQQVIAAFKGYEGLK